MDEQARAVLWGEAAATPDQLADPTFGRVLFALLHTYGDLLLAQQPDDTKPGSSFATRSGSGSGGVEPPLSAGSVTAATATATAAAAAARPRPTKKRITPMPASRPAEKSPGQAAFQASLASTDDFPALGSAPAPASKSKEPKPQAGVATRRDPQVTAMLAARDGQTWAQPSASTTGHRRVPVSRPETSFSTSTSSTTTATATPTPTPTPAPSTPTSAGVEDRLAAAGVLAAVDEAGIAAVAAAVASVLCGGTAVRVPPQLHFCLRLFMVIPAAVAPSTSALQQTPPVLADATSAACFGAHVLARCGSLLALLGDGSLRLLARSTRAAVLAPALVARAVDLLKTSGLPATLLPDLTKVDVSVAVAAFGTDDRALQAAALTQPPTTALTGNTSSSSNSNVMDESRVFQILERFRDDLRFLHREWEKDESGFADKAKRQLGNALQFPRLFAQVFCETLLGEHNSDSMGALRLSNPAKVADLAKRLAGGGRDNKIDTDRFFGELVVASDSHLLVVHLCDRLVWEIRSLYSTALQVVVGGSSNCNRMAHSAHAWQPDSMMRAVASQCRLAKVLGVALSFAHTKGNAMDQWAVGPNGTVLRIAAAGGNPGLDLIAFLRHAYVHGHLTLTLPWVCQALAGFAFDTNVPFFAACVTTLTSILSSFRLDCSTLGSVYKHVFYTEIICELLAQWKVPLPENGDVTTPVVAPDSCTLDSRLPVSAGLLEKCCFFVGDIRQDLQAFLRQTQAIDDTVHFVPRKRLVPSTTLLVKGPTASNFGALHLETKQPEHGTATAVSGAAVTVAPGDRWGQYRTSADITLVQADVRRLVIFNTLYHITSVIVPGEAPNLKLHLSGFFGSLPPGYDPVVLVEKRTDVFRNVSAKLQTVAKSYASTHCFEEVVKAISLLAPRAEKIGQTNPYAKVAISGWAELAAQQTQREVHDWIELEMCNDVARMVDTCFQVARRTILESTSEPGNSSSAVATLEGSLPAGGSDNKPASLQRLASVASQSMALSENWEADTTSLLLEFSQAVSMTPLSGIVPDETMLFFAARMRELPPPPASSQSSIRITPVVLLAAELLHAMLLRQGEHGPLIVDAHTPPPAELQTGESATAKSASQPSLSPAAAALVTLLTDCAAACPVQDRGANVAQPVCSVLLCPQRLALALAGGLSACFPLLQQLPALLIALVDGQVVLPTMLARAVLGALKEIHGLPACALTWLRQCMFALVRLYVLATPSAAKLPLASTGVAVFADVLGLVSAEAALVPHVRDLLLGANVDGAMLLD